MRCPNQVPHVALFSTNSSLKFFNKQLSHMHCCRHLLFTRLHTSSDKYTPHYHSYPPQTCTSMHEKYLQLISPCLFSLCCSLIACIFVQVLIINMMHRLVAPLFYVPSFARKWLLPTHPYLKMQRENARSPSLISQHNQTLGASPQHFSKFSRNGCFKATKSMYWFNIYQ